MDCDPLGCGSQVGFLTTHDDMSKMLVRQIARQIGALRVEAAAVIAFGFQRRFFFFRRGADKSSTRRPIIGKILRLARLGNSVHGHARLKIGDALEMWPSFSLFLAAHPDLCLDQFPRDGSPQRKGADH